MRHEKKYKKWFFIMKKNEEKYVTNGHIVLEEGFFEFKYHEKEINVPSSLQLGSECSTNYQFEKILTFPINYISIIKIGDDYACMDNDYLEMMPKGSKLMYQGHLKPIYICRNNRIIGAIMPVRMPDSKYDKIIDAIQKLKNLKNEEIK